MDPRDPHGDEDEVEFFDEDEDEVEFFDALDSVSDLEGEDNDEAEEALSDASTTTLPPLESLASDASELPLESLASDASELPLESLALDASELTSEVPAQRGYAILDPDGDIEDPPLLLTLLEYAVGFAVRAVSFQITLLVIFIKLPFWLIRLSFLIVVDPCGVICRARDAAKDRFSEAFRFFFEKVIPVAFARGAKNQVAVNLAARLARGCFCSLYVGFVLFAFLAASFLGGALMVRRVLEEPVQVTAELSFDYTKASPEAFVPIPLYGGCSLSGEMVDLASHDVWRLVPPNQKMRLTISLTLPESDYNRKLGVFQVMAEFLTSNGNVTSISRQPCLLLFKSSYIHSLETFLKSMFLLAGYSSESQVLRLQMRGLTEGTKPTVCIRVTLEKRAEFLPGAGIPEIYAASMKLESELSLFERLMWNWKLTVFIWISMVLFMMQLLIVLVCCRHVILPTA